MTTLALWVSLLFVSVPAQAPAQAQTKTPPPAVSLVDLLVEGQTLYTLAVDKQTVNLTAALELARQAQQAVADDTVKKRLPAGARPDDQDLAVLGSLRARISVLVASLEDQIRLEKLNKPSGASNKKWLTQGLIFAAVLAGTGGAAHFAMNDKLDQMSFVPAGSSEWWALYDNADQLRQVRNGFYVAAVGAGVAVTIYGAVKGSRSNKSPSRVLAPFGPRTFLGFNIDPRRPAFMFVRIF
jgi:hypothetical protein